MVRETTVREIMAQEGRAQESRARGTRVHTRKVIAMMVPDPVGISGPVVSRPYPMCFAAILAAANEAIEAGPAGQVWIADRVACKVPLPLPIGAMCWRGRRGRIQQGAT